MELLLASSNIHKAEELSLILEDIRIKIPENSIDVIEDGKTFEENAYKKANAYYQKFKVPVIADDSGLIVSALPDELGIFSARFGEEGMNYREKCELLLQKLENKKTLAERYAYFTSTICLILNELEVYFFNGKLEGHIGYELRGESGFGFDPVFIPDDFEDKTLAQLPEWKNQNSHRAQASFLLKKFFKERLSK